MNRSDVLYAASVIALIVAAIAVGLENFAVAIGVGLTGVTLRERIRLALVFGLFEAGMPLVGLVVGHGIAQSIGGVARYLGGALLIAIGVWALLETRRVRSGHHPDVATATRADGVRGWSRLVVTAFALSIDNLVVGFGLGVTHTPFATALVVFAAVSVALSLLGLELGSRLGKRVEANSEMLAGIVLVVVGVLVTTRAI